jgi:hypothetical protein
MAYKAYNTNIEVKVKLLHIQCHVLEFTKVKAQKSASKDRNRVYAETFYLSR